MAQSCASTGAPSASPATSAIVDFPVACSPVTRTRSTSGGASLRHLLPHRHVLVALAREGLAPPVGPALTQAHAGDARHEVELGGPHEAPRRREGLGLPVREPVVVRHSLLVGDVQGVEPSLVGVTMKACA